MSEIKPTIECFLAELETHSPDEYNLLLDLEQKDRTKYEERLQELFEEWKANIEKKDRERPKTELDLLDEAERTPKYLDLGEHKGTWYFGFLVEGREAIVTDKRHFLRNTEEHFKGRKIGENKIRNFLGECQGYIGEIAPLWHKKSIKEFLTKQITINKNGLYRQVREKILYYMDFGEQEEIADVQACWIIATYCYPLFYWFPHLLFVAPSESGKTKNAFVIMKLSFRGFDLGASGGVTPAQLFRTIEGNRGTMLIDEYEKADTETQKLVNQILNASATNDAYVVRTEQINRKWRAWKFPIFCPKIVCNISGINPTSLSRFIPFRLLKTKTEKGKRKPFRRGDIEQFEPIRNDLHILILQNWKEIKQIYDSLDIDLTNRDEDSWLPICAIAKWLGEDIFNSVINYIKTYQEIKIEGNDLVETLLLTIHENITDNDIFYSLKEIVEWCGEYLQRYKSPERWAGKILTNYKFVKTRRGKGYYYALTKSKVKDILDRYFPNCTEQTTQNTTTTTTTTTTQNTPESVVNECSDVTPERGSNVLHKCISCGTTKNVAFNEQGKPECEVCSKAKQQPKKGILGGFL